MFTTAGDAFLTASLNELEIIFSEDLISGKFLLFLKVRVEINRPNRVPMKIAPRRGKYFLLFKKFTFKE